MKARSRKTYFLKRKNDERRSKGIPRLPNSMYRLLADADCPDSDFGNRQAQFLVDFMNTVEARQGRMVKKFDILLAKKLLYKLMASYNHFVLLSEKYACRIDELAEKLRNASR
jgi:hypothetical protein